EVDVKCVSTLQVGTLERQPDKEDAAERVSRLHVRTMADSGGNGTSSGDEGKVAAQGSAANGRGWIDRLTPAERRVLEMIADNRMSRQIAGELRISTRTVEGHRSKIRSKLGLSGPNVLLRFALEHRWEILGAAGKC